MRESAFYICKNKGSDQLSSNRTAEQRLSFRYIHNTNTLLHESEMLNLRPSSMLYSPRPICGSWSVEHRFSQKDPMTAEVVACINFTYPKLLGFDI